MGISLGWIALLLGVTGAQPADKNAAQITYTVRMVEAEGVGWRASVMSQLKPVTRQGSATVWTLPAGASSRLIKEFDKNPAVTVAQSLAHRCIFRSARDNPGPREPQIRDEGLLEWR